MTEQEKRQEARELLRAVFDDTLSRLVIAFDCDCGQRLALTTAEATPGARLMAENTGAILVNVDQGATCPKCGAVVWHVWSKAFSFQSRTMTEALDGAIDDLGPGELDAALAELRQEAEARQEARARLN